MATRRRLLFVLALIMMFAASACNLSGAPSEEQIAQTATAAVTLQPSRTPASTSGIPTTIPLTQPSPLPTFQFPTAIVVVPTNRPPTSVPPPVFPTNTPLPVSIVILSPVSGNVVAGNVQILGSASHPQFLQYQVEFGPDPNPGNLWFPATSAVTSPVLNGLLGIWNTTSIQDNRYQLRLRVYLRDGTLLTTVIPNITVQNRINTPIPSPTQNIPRPIAAFTQDRAAGDVPLTVQFINQSTGTMNAISWNFGDGTSSNEVNPRHSFVSPGLYTVTLSVSGPGGSSNVSRQINATSPTAPVAGFTQDRTSGVAPLTVQFTDQSVGNISARLWNFSDGATSTDRNPTHTFNVPGTYNVFLTVSGPGGSSSVTRQITVSSLTPPTSTPSLTFTPTFTPTNTTVPPTATFTPTPTTTTVPPTATFTPTATTVPPTATFTETPTNTTTPVTPTLTFTPTFTPTFTETLIPPTLTFTPTFTPTFTETLVPPTLTFTPTFTPTFTETPVPPTLTFTPTATNTELPPPPQAFFAANTAPSDPLTVQFTDQSSGTVAARAWDFGDGSTSSEQNPSHTYNAPGTYTVTLTVADSLGQSTNYSAQVTVSAPVQAAFSAQPSNLSVQFVDQSTGPIAGYAWDFGDGSTSSEQNPSHTYAAPGTYTVTLGVAGTNGSTNITNQQVTVSAPVQAAFTAQPSDLTVQFVDQSTGPVAAYTWNFGDGGSSNEQNPSHAYAAGGAYTVTLTVADASGGNSTTSQQVSVSEPINASFTAQATDLNVQFMNQSTGPVSGFAWDFGDGGTSNEQNPLHTYNAPGSYTVTLTVSSNTGGSDSDTQQVTVNAAVQANFSAQPTDLNVQFVDQSTGQIAGYQWDFGDGGTSNEQSPLHTYAAPGTYTVTLTVTGSSGGTNTTSQQVTVAAAAEANFAAQVTNLDVQFTDQSTGQVVAYQWDFGDGTGSNEQNPLHTYNAPGSYTVTLVVTGSDGRTDDQSQVVDVTAALQAAFTAQPTDLNVQFTDQSTGAIAAYLWDFGDGNTSNEQSPLHTYPAEGTYTVTLTITGGDGSTDGESQDVTVTAAQQSQQPTIVDTTPILPDFNQLHDLLRGIYANGVNSFGNQATVFSTAGDSVFSLSGILSPFATGDYNLGNKDSLQPIIDWFNTTDLGDVTSFNSTSAAVNTNWRAQDLLDPAQADPSCNGESPLACELHRTHPVLMFVAVGRNDALSNTDPATFQSMLNQIVATISSNGTIPVLLTIPDDGSNPSTQAINEVIITVAQQNGIPLLNAARALNELPAFNLDTSPNGPGALGDNAVSNFGINVLNFNLLQVLSDARNIIFPDA